MRRGAALLAAGALLLGGCSHTDEDAGPPTVTARPSAEAVTPPAKPSGPSGGAGPPKVLRVLADHLAVPWGIDFLPDGTAVVTERDTRRVLTIDAGGRVTEVGTVEEAAPQGEAGLLGVAVSPSYAEDALVYLYVSTPEDNRIVRATLDGDRLGEPDVVLDGIPNGFIHDGGRLASRSSPPTSAPWAARSCGSRLTATRRPATPTPTPRPGPTGTATCRAWPSTTATGSGPRSSATRPSTS